MTSDPLTTGSLGAGITLRPCVAAQVIRGREDRVLVNSKTMTHGLIETVKRITGSDAINVEITTPALLGEGLGFSAALSIVVASSALINTGRSATLTRAGVIAHEAEVMMLTGLGDVAAELRGGGLVVRVKPGAPGVGEVDVSPVRDSVSIVACLVRSDLTTPDMLRVHGLKIKEVGGGIFRRFIAEPSFDRFLELSHEFSRSVFITNDADSTLRSALGRYLKSGEVLTYFIKKGTLVVVTSGKPSMALLEDVGRVGIRLIGVFEPSFEGTTMVFSS
ncbi:MAG: hypothetical protein QXP80_04055 [Zestosphaera sp.]